MSYNTGTSTGCPVCLARSARQAPPTRPGMRVSPFRITAVAIAAWGAYLAMTRSMTVLAEEGAAAYEETRRTFGRLNPNTYRVEIEALERAVYDTEAGPYQGSAVASAAMALSNSMGLGSEDNQAMHAMLRRHSSAILLYGGALSSTDDIGYGGYNGDYARTEWEKIRGEAFTGADWYQGSPAGAASSDVPADPAATVTTIGRRAINDLTLGLENLLRFTRSALPLVGEPLHPDGSREAQKVAAAWNETRSAIHGRLKTMNASLASNGLQLNRAERSAHGFLEQSVLEFDRLSTMAHVPTRLERQQVLDQVRYYLDEAGRILQTGG